MSFTIKIEHQMRFAASLRHYRFKALLRPKALPRPSQGRMALNLCQLCAQSQAVHRLMRLMPSSYDAVCGLIDHSQKRLLGTILPQKPRGGGEAIHSGPIVGTGLLGD